MAKAKWILTFAAVFLLLMPDVSAQVRRMKPGVRNRQPPNFILGARLDPLDAGNKHRLGLGGHKGILVTRVPQISEAYTQGLRKDDLLKTWNGHKLINLAAFRSQIAVAQRGERIKLTLVRKGKVIKHSIVLALTKKGAKAESKKDVVKTKPAPAPNPGKNTGSQTQDTSTPPPKIKPATPPGEKPPIDVVKIPPKDGPKPPPAPKPTQPIKPGPQKPVPLPPVVPDEPVSPQPPVAAEPGGGVRGDREYRRGRLSPTDRLKDRSLRRSRPGSLGLSVLALDQKLALEYGVKPQKGVLVVAVGDGSRGAQAGFQVGDVILKVNKQKVTAPAAVSQLVRSSGSAKVVFRIDRKGQQVDLVMEGQGQPSKRQPTEI